MLQQVKKNKLDSEKLRVIAYLIVDLTFQINFRAIRARRINNSYMVIYSFVFRLVYKANKL